MASSCIDCINYDACKVAELNASNEVESWCDLFKDRSLFVKLPCKVGDMVYCLALPEKRRVTRITVTQYELRITVNDMFSFDMSQIGKTVFLTEEEFEYALQLKQLKTGDKNA